MVHMGTDESASAMPKLRARQAASGREDLNWVLLLPLVFAGNVVVASLAWFLVGLLMR
jgi:hypothetical protein